MQEQKRQRNSEQIVKAIMLGVLFLCVTCIAIIFIREDKKLAYVLQKWVYSVGMAVLIAGLLVNWVFTHMQTHAGRRPRHGRWFYPVVAGVLGLFCMAMAYTYLGVWPLADKSVMIVDMHHQYAPLLSKLRDMLLNGGSPFYLFEAGLGSAFLPLFGYYLASPFNLLLVFFPEHLLTEGILVITLLKVGLSAAFFAACVQYIYRRRDICVPIMAVMYALMMYMLAYSWNIMWLDCVMVLPLVVLFFEKMMRTGKIPGYVLSLAYALYANYYIGFMLCIFLVLYFIAYVLRERRSMEKQAYGVLRFIGASALGGGLVMFLLVPVYLGLGHTSAVNETFPKLLSSNFDLFDLLGRHLYETSPTIRSGNLPNIYCGVLSVLLLPLFATTRTIPLRRRLTYLGLLFVLALSFSLNYPNLLWHGLHSPNDLPYRFSFIYSFVLLLIGYEVLLQLRHVTFKQIGFSFVGILAYLMLEERFGDEAYVVHSIYFSLFFIAVYAIILSVVVRKKHLLRPAYSALLLVVVLEMVWNGGATYLQLNDNEHFTPHQSYVDNDTTEAIRQAVNRAKEIGDAELAGDFYRMELAPRRTYVDTALFDYRGITLFASSNYYETTKFLGNIGYPINGVNSHYFRNFVAPSDSLLGIRYVVLDEDTAKPAGLKQLDKVEVGDVTYYIYENTQALPVGFVVQENVKDWQPAYYNPFQAQNSLFTLMTGNGQPVYVYQDVAVYEESRKIASINEGNTHSFFINPTAEKKTANFAVTIKGGGQTYIYLDCGAAKSMSASANGANGRETWSVSSREPYIIDAGVLAEGETVSVSITVDGACSGNIYVMTLDEDVFDRDIQLLADNGLHVQELGDSSLKGTVSSQNGGTLFTSIPYDPGWQVKVDGKSVETFAVCSSFLAFDIGEGSHDVEITFFPSGLILGIVLSTASLVLLLTWVLVDRKYRKYRYAERRQLRMLAGGDKAHGVKTMAEAAADEEQKEAAADNDQQDHPPTADA